MSMFENKTKPELERGNFIAYADEPGTVISGSGGGAAYLELDFDGLQEPPYVPQFTYTDAKNGIAAGKFVCARAVYSVGGLVPGDDDTYNVIELLPVLTVFDNGEDSYNVTTMDYRFTASSPDATMTPYIE